MGWRRTLTRSIEEDQPSVQVKHSDTPSYYGVKHNRHEHESSKDSLCKALEDTLIISTRDADPEHVRSTDAPRAPVSVLLVSPPELPTFSPAEVAKHTSEENGGVWIAIEHKVFDVTSFMKLQHPGGMDVIEAFAGKQCDWQFDCFHHPRHLEQYEEQLLIGFVHPIPQNPFPRPPKELKADWRVE